MVDSTNLPNVDINQIATDLNNKMDRDATNSLAPYVISRQIVDDVTVEIWSDGFCIQTGTITIARQNANVGVETNVTLPQPYRDSDYYVAPLSFITDGGQTMGLRNFKNTRSPSTLAIGTYSTTSVTNNYTAQWRTEGYIR